MSINFHSHNVEDLSVNVEGKGDSELIVFPDDLADFKDVLERTDNNEILQIFSYTHCDNSTSNNVKKLRGMVYSGNKKLFSSLGYTQEYNETEGHLFHFDKETQVFFPAEEGTLLRAFFFGDQWYLSTNRKLDAFRSRWGGPMSFGEIFTAALLAAGFVCNEEGLSNPRKVFEFFAEKELNPENVYLFLVRNNQGNRIVSKAPQVSTAYHVGTILLSQGGELSLNAADAIPHVKRQERLEFTSLGDLLDYVKNTDPLVRQGVIAFLPDGTQTKFVNSKYQLYSQVRGNESSVKFRYLNVRTNPTYLRLIHELYPEHIQTFSLYETTLFKIAKKIHACYIKRFINKEHVVTDQISYRIIREAHGRHIENRKVKVTLEMILSILSEPRFVSTLNALIKQELSPRMFGEAVGL